MKILIFTEGTILIHPSAKGRSQKEIVQQVLNQETSITDFSNYIPIGQAISKLRLWSNDGAEISYLTSRTEPKEIEQIRQVLTKNGFPEGELYYRQGQETYADVVTRVLPDILIEDDCESIGGEKEMTITKIKPELKKLIKSVIVLEFGGVDHLPHFYIELLHYSN